MTTTPTPTPTSTVQDLRLHRRPRTKTDGLWLRDYGRPITGLDPAGGPSLPALSRLDWKTTGSCTKLESDWWFTDHETSHTARAVAICAACPVRELCLAAALIFDEEYGIWGGLTPTERRPLVARLEHGDPLGTVLTDALEVNHHRVEAA